MLEDPVFTTKIPGLHPGWNVVYDYIHHPQLIHQRHQDPEWCRLVNHVVHSSLLAKAWEPIREELGPFQAHSLVVTILGHEVRIQEVIQEYALEDKTSSYVLDRLVSLVERYQEDIKELWEMDYLPQGFTRDNVIPVGYQQGLEGWITQHFRSA